VASVTDLRVLLIDDGDTRDFLANTLRHYGANVTAASSVREALAALGRVDPQVLVCNCEMGDVDTAMLVQAIRSLEAAQQRRIPTIAVAPVERTRQASLGFHISLPRPLNPQVLVSLMGKLTPTTPAS